MKRLVTAALIAALLLNAFPASARSEALIYQAENARLTGRNAVSLDASASGGKTVGRFEGAEDTVEFTISVAKSGAYDLIFTAKGIGGSKVNKVLVDGEYLDQFEIPSTAYTDSALRGVLLTEGEHTVTVTPFWGWMFLDSLTVAPGAAISDDVYQVSAPLIDPNADEAARSLYALLQSLYGKYTLAGQVCDDGLSGAEFQAIHEVTGRYPALLGLDMMDYTPARVQQGARSHAVERAIEFHNAGGIVTFCWHWSAPSGYILDGRDKNGNPRWWGGFYTENTSFDIDAVMNGRDEAGKRQLDEAIAAIAEKLNILRDAGVPVLWRPLHEASGGWFWWGAKGPEPYLQLWRYLYHALTETYGCSNLIWVWNGQGAEWYPGDEYVDIIGEDIYAEKHSYGPQNTKFTELTAYSETPKIIALTENGVVFDIDRAVEANARWAWFCTWCGDFAVKGKRYSEEYTEKSILQRAYDSPYVLTLDKLTALTSGKDGAS